MRGIRGVFTIPLMKHIGERRRAQGEEAPAGPFLAQGHTRARGRLTVRNVSYTNSRAAGDSLPARRVRGGPLRQLAMSGLPARLPAGAERAKRFSFRMDGMTAKPGTTSTADRILDAAIGLMNTKGYNPVSVREIAKAVGLSEMTVFRHFPSKYAMLMAAMRRAPYAEMIEDVFTTHVRWELEHDLRHFMRRYMDIAEQRIGIWRIYFSAIGQIDEHSTELVSDVTSFRERLRAYFEEMIRRGHIRQLDSLYVSSLFWNLIFGFVMTLVIGRKRPGLVRDEYIENAVSVFIGGVAPKEGEAWR